MFIAKFLTVAALATTLIAGSLTPPCADAKVIRNEYFPHHNSDDTVAKRAFSNQESSVRFIINGIPIGHTKISSAEWTGTEAQLSEALDLARQTKDTDPRTCIDMLQQSAALYYRQQQYLKAAELLEESITVQTASFGPGHPDLADSYDMIAQVSRASHNYEFAINFYKQALAIRSSTAGPTHIDTAAEYINLANVYSDLGDEAKQHEAEDNARRITEGKQKVVFISATTTPGRPRPIPTSITPPTFSETDNILANADGIITRHKIDEARKVAEEEARRAIMEEAEKRAKFGPGIANLYGTVQVAMDRRDCSTLTKNISETETKTETSTQVKETTKASDVEDFEVALLPADMTPKLWETIERVGQKRHIANPTTALGKNWPGIYQQAKELLIAMSAKVIGASPKVVLTNKLGEFTIDDVPAGDYILYGQLTTRQEAMFWIIPIKVEQPDSIRADFLVDNATIVWQKNKQAPIPRAKSQSNLGSSLDAR